MRNIKVVLAYDGTRYCGFQKQPGGLPTVQGVLEESLARLAGTEIRVTAAGRTDAGVHARGQVVNFFIDRTIPTDRVVPALNGLLPHDIAALAAEEVPPGFHARKSARAKTYVYTVYNAPVRHPLYRLYALHVDRPLDLGAMQAAAIHFVGTHDFSSFQNSGRPVVSAVRHLYEGRVERDGPFVKFTFCADGFLYQMVRIMVGTLLEVGLGRLQPDAVGTILAARDRAQAGPTAPPHGLCLEHVEY
ncbi:MAG: tRNA pseudouridine(38-40) synthase TruA [Desulfotomaculales bacterium]